MAIHARDPIITKKPRQGQSGFVRATLRDQDGALVPSATYTTFTVTVYELTTGKIVNGRDHQDALGAAPGQLGANGVTLGAVDGSWRWDWTSADAQPLPELLGRDVNVHIATFRRTWGDEGRGDSFDVRLEIGKVTRL